MDKCPVCGYVENLKTKPLHNRMSMYVYLRPDEKGNDIPFGVMNSDENYITIPANSEKKTPEIKLRKEGVKPSAPPAETKK